MAEAISTEPGDSDRALWRRFTATVQPLFGRVVVIEADAPPADAARSVERVSVRTDVRPLAPITIGVPPAGLDRATWLRLKRGRAAPDRRLDLHGLRAEAAFVAVEGFVVGAAAVGIRVVEVVTGRGFGAEGGVIRRALPDWLNGPTLRPLVLAACHPRAENSGAVVLLLRRRLRARPPRFPPSRPASSD